MSRKKRMRRQTALRSLYRCECTVENAVECTRLSTAPLLARQRNAILSSHHSEWTRSIQVTFSHLESLSLVAWSGFINDSSSLQTAISRNKEVTWSYEVGVEDKSKRDNIRQAGRRPSASPACARHQLKSLRQTRLCDRLRILFPPAAQRGVKVEADTCP